MQGLEEENVISQHDNDPKYTAHYILDWLLAQKFQVIWHLLQSPNHNLIVHLRNEVDGHKKRSERKLTSKNDL